MKLVDMCPTANQAAHLKKLVQIQYAQGDGQEALTVYKLMTSVAGFVNAPPGIGKVNAVFKLEAGHSLGEHSLYLELSKNVAKGKEILAAYGKHYNFGEAGAAKRAKRAATKANEERAASSSTHQ